MLAPELLCGELLMSAFDCSALHVAAQFSVHSCTAEAFQSKAVELRHCEPFVYRATLTCLLMDRNDRWQDVICLSVWTAVYSPLFTTLTPCSITQYIVSSPLFPSLTIPPPRPPLFLHHCSLPFLIAFILSSHLVLSISSTARSFSPSLPPSPRASPFSCPGVAAVTSCVSQPCQLVNTATEAAERVCVCVCVYMSVCRWETSESERAASHLLAVIHSPPLLPWSSSRLNHDSVCTKGWGNTLCVCCTGLSVCIQVHTSAMKCLHAALQCA